MDLDTFLDLLTPSGQEALAVAQGLNPREEDFLPLFGRLCRQFPKELARASLEIVILRAEGAKKFPDAARMYFTREALEQASSSQVSRQRAQRYRGFAHIIDLGCSIGGDTLSLVSAAPTLGIDHDSLRLAMARENLRAHDLDAGFVLADLLTWLPFPLDEPSKTALFFDPSRRRDNRRAFSVQSYSPPLQIIKNWQGRCPALGVKISPGVKLPEIAEYDAELEFVSLEGELKEARLWFGPFKTTARRATLLPGDHTLQADVQSILPAALSQPLAFLYEPDPAILRAGLVRTLAIQIQASQLDAEIAYLTSPEKVSTPFARVWQIEDWFPFGLKRLRSYLRARHAGQVVIKKRGSPLQPEALLRDLRLKGEAQRVVFLTHLQGRPIAVICYSNDIIQEANSSEGDYRSY